MLQSPGFAAGSPVWMDRQTQVSFLNSSSDRQSCIPSRENGLKERSEMSHLVLSSET